MKKETIAIDIDDTLCRHFEGLMNWYNASFDSTLELADNHPFSPEHWGTPDLQKDTLRRWNAQSVSQAVFRVHTYFDTPEFRESEPFADAVRTIKMLANDFQIIIVTARESLIEGLTREWLTKYFGGLIKDIYFTSRYDLQGNSRSKKDILHDTKVSYVIDDSLETCLEAISVGIGAILYGDYPWNQTDNLPASVHRVVGWKEVLEYFDARS